MRRIGGLADPIIGTWGREQRSQTRRSSCPWRLGASQAPGLPPAGLQAPRGRDTNSTVEYPVHLEEHA